MPCFLRHYKICANILFRKIKGFQHRKSHHKQRSYLILDRLNPNIIFPSLERLQPGQMPGRVWVEKQNSPTTDLSLKYCKYPDLRVSQNKKWKIWGIRAFVEGMSRRFLWKLLQIDASLWDAQKITTGNL